MVDDEWTAVVAVASDCVIVESLFQIEAVYPRVVNFTMSVTSQCAVTAMAIDSPYEPIRVSQARAVCAPRNSNLVGGHHKWAALAHEAIVIDIDEAVYLGILNGNTGCGSTLGTIAIS